jgi:hypothetical protein
MKKILEKKVEHIYVILALFIVVVGGLFYFQVKSEKKLTDVKQLLRITIVEAIDHGVDADSLKEKYVENDSLNNGRR